MCLGVNPVLNPIVHNGYVCSFQEMPRKKKTKTSSVEERPNKEHLCPECKKPFLRKTDMVRHVEMKHLLVKRECRHCGTILGSVSALRRHLEKQHQIKLSTRPDDLDPEQWKMTPLDGNPIPERMEVSDGEGSSSRDTLTVRSILTDVSSSGGAASASFVPASSVARPAGPAGSTAPLRSGDSGSYIIPTEAEETENHPPTVEKLRVPIPSDQEISEGREQLQEWRKELIAAPRPIIKEFWLTRWRKQTPRLGFATRLAAEAMLDVAVIVTTKGQERTGSGHSISDQTWCSASTNQTLHGSAE